MNPEQTQAIWLTTVIQDFAEDASENSLQGAVTERAFERPLVGFSRGDDPLYAAYKDHVGAEHWTPQEIFNRVFPERPALAEELTVVCWVLPHTAATKKDNRKQRKFPSERWARARIFGEHFNRRMREHVAATLRQAGYDALAPSLLPDCSARLTGPYTYESNWSERHVAYAAGLGTFGLCDGLITPKGKAMRVGTVVARIQIPPTPRPYTHHREYCLFFVDHRCRACIDRCPVGAITAQGHHKALCKAHLFPVTETYVQQHFHFAGYGCGLCQTGVPCESGIPRALGR
jgi:epoxyqueuosine reductase